MRRPKGSWVTRTAVRTCVLALGSLTWQSEWTDVCYVFRWRGLAYRRYSASRETRAAAAGHVSMGCCRTSHASRGQKEDIQDRARCDAKRE